MKKLYTTLAGIILISTSIFAQTLVASYPFNGNANDASGNGNNGTVNGATLTTDRFGNANSAYSFNGSGNYIQVPNSASLQLTNNYTISAWVKPNAFGFTGQCTSNFIVSKGQFNDEGTFYLTYSDFDISCSVFTPSTEYFWCASFQGGTQYYANDPSNPIQLNKWYMVTSVRNGNQISIYVNGQLKNTTDISGTLGAVNSSPLIIGGDPSNAMYPNWQNGTIDDIKIYNSSLSASQIFDTYVNDLKRPGSGNALLFDHTLSQYIDIGSGWVPESSFTFETWVKRTSTDVTDAQVQLFIGSLNDNGWGVGIQQAGGTNKINLTQIGTSNILSATAITDTLWHHVAVTFDAKASQAVFYIDGIADPPVSYSPNFNSGNSDYRLGGRNPTGNINQLGFLNGIMDETRIWDTVLTQNEIRDWMCKKVNSAHPDFAHLSAYYRYDEGSGTVAYSVGGHPGVLTNSPTWVTSGASLGDASAYDFTNSTKSASIGSPTGETFTVTSTLGNPAGIQVYRVDTLPNTLTGTVGTGSNYKYFGVFQSGGTSPLYSAVYNYGGYAAISANDPTGFRLYRRRNNAGVIWTDAVATLNTTNKTLTVAGASTEYMLGSVLNALPVTLISFSAIKNGSDVVLNWQTTNEENLKNYVVEKSTDPSTFTQLALVNANDNTGINNYTATDMNPENGINYYRLKQIDADGKYTYSVIRSVNFSDNFKIFISPNPATSNIKIYTDQMLMGVQIMDVSGKIIKWLIPTSDNLYDVSDLQKGIYFLRITTKTEIQTLRLAKL